MSADDYDFSVFAGSCDGTAEPVPMSTEKFAELTKKFSNYINNRRDSSDNNNQLLDVPPQFIRKRGELIAANKK